MVLGVPDPNVAALRQVVTGLLTTPDAHRAIALEISGIGIAYPGTTGRATGIPAAPDGRAILIGAPLPEGWADRVETRDGTEPRLVRPDGYLAWSGGPGLTEALRRWFGTEAALVESRTTRSGTMISTPITPRNART
jgi:hypothetical protein